VLALLKVGREIFVNQDFPLSFGKVFNHDSTIMRGEYKVSTASTLNRPFVVLDIASILHGAQAFG
jgi:hypothetical protein